MKAVINLYTAGTSEDVFCNVEFPEVANHALDHQYPNKIDCVYLYTYNSHSKLPNQFLKMEPQQLLGKTEVTVNTHKIVRHKTRKCQPSERVFFLSFEGENSLWINIHGINVADMGYKVVNNLIYAPKNMLASETLSQRWDCIVFRTIVINNRVIKFKMASYKDECSKIIDQMRRAIRILYNLNYRTEEEFEEYKKLLKELEAYPLKFKLLKEEWEEMTVENWLKG